MKDIYKVSISYWKMLPSITLFVKASSRFDVLKWAEQQISFIDKTLGSYNINVDTITEDDLTWIDPEEIQEI